VRRQNGIPQLVHHIADTAFTQCRTAGDIPDDLRHLARPFPLDLGAILANGCNLSCHGFSCLNKEMTGSLADYSNISARKPYFPVEIDESIYGLVCKHPTRFESLVLEKNSIVQPNKSSPHRHDYNAVI
jgi:hypothetical protein